MTVIWSRDLFASNEDFSNNKTQFLFQILKKKTFSLDFSQISFLNQTNQNLSWAGYHRPLSAAPLASFVSFLLMRKIKIIINCRGNPGEFQQPKWTIIFCISIIYNRLYIFLFIWLSAFEISMHQLHSKNHWRYCVQSTCTLLIDYSSANFKPLPLLDLGINLLKYHYIVVWSEMHWG